MNPSWYSCEKATKVKHGLKKKISYKENKGSQNIIPKREGRSKIKHNSHENKHRSDFTLKNKDK